MRTATETAGLIVAWTMLAIVAGCGGKGSPAPGGAGDAAGSPGAVARAGGETARPAGELAADTTPAGRGMMGGMMGRPADTAAAPAAKVSAASAPGCPDISRALADAGRKVFSGPGTCFACHGANARGSVVAPNLTDSTWLNIDGSYATIAELVRSGVPHPKKYPAPMPPMGGAHLTSEQVCAVAAYVHGLGGGKG